MEQCGDWRRGNHGSQKPGLERHLSGFGTAGIAEKSYRQQQNRALESPANDVLHGQGGPASLSDIQINDRNDKRRAARGVHPQSPRGVLYGELRLIVGNQHEGAHGGDFPEEVQPD